MTTTTTKSRPILFSAPMVRAILAGQKTVTRRIVKFRETGQPPSQPDRFNAEAFVQSNPCPYGKPGDDLWVRENLRVTEDDICYAADGAPIDMDAVVAKHGEKSLRVGTVPCIHMPHWACRITLRIVSVRVERVQDITTEEVEREGWIKRTDIDNPHVHDDAARDWFMDLWNDINGPGSWESNPWVWRVQFQRVEVTA